MTSPAVPAADSAPQEQLLLWIDGVGAYLVCLADRVTIGGPAGTSREAAYSEPCSVPDGASIQDASAACVTLLANLSRRHATIVRSGEGYLLEAHAATQVCGRPVPERTDLADGYEIELGRGVRMLFRVPTVLSATAVLDFLSGHRPHFSVDGIILMAENCLLGPRRDDHVRCPDWPGPVLLYRSGGRLCCKANSAVFIDEKLSRTGGPIEPGSVVTGEDFRFRLEECL